MSEIAPHHARPSPRFTILLLMSSEMPAQLQLGAVS